MTSAHSISAPYEQLVSEALAAPFTGWDFGWLRDRTSGDQLSWDYSDLARAALAGATAVLDIDTGGGELLAGLAPLPAHTVATEAWEPNLPVARERLGPLGVEVRAGRGDRLVAADGEFDLVLNRHGSFTPAELWRVLVPGGVFLTQQPGSRNDQEFYTVLGTQPPLASRPRLTPRWRLDSVEATLPASCCVASWLMPGISPVISAIDPGIWVAPRCRTGRPALLKANSGATSAAVPSGTAGGVSESTDPAGCACG